MASETNRVILIWMDEQYGARNGYATDRWIVAKEDRFTGENQVVLGGGNYADAVRLWGKHSGRQLTDQERRWISRPIGQGGCPARSTR